MTRKEIDSKLQGMLNKTYTYGTHAHCITRYECDDEKERVYIYTDRKGVDPFNRTYGDLNLFLKEWKPINDLVPATAEITPVNNTIKQLQQILLENINKVRADANYIPQAKSINNNVNSIINLAKIQVMMMRRGD